ncbi:MAG: hypothetical protein IPK32_02675 [Verrucomicrobiaceae bacterium]|nr:hypothetical protein [Verrucomicrobiaceae bacterium]
MPSVAWKSSSSAARTARRSVSSPQADGERTPVEHLFRESATKDFIDYGFEAEFIGRLPVRVVCDPLSAGDLFDIMKTSEGSLIRQYEREFGAYGVKATFTDDALHLIAKRAAEEKTGARGLVTAWERVLRDFKFELPSLGLPEIEIDAALIEKPAAAMHRCREAASRIVHDFSAAHTGEVNAFVERFDREHGFLLRFDAEAITAIARRALLEGLDVPSMCQKLFKDYPFGLTLVARGTDNDEFDIPASAIANTDSYLSELVVQACRPPQEEATTVEDAAPPAAAAA